MVTRILEGVDAGSLFITSRKGGERGRKPAYLRLANYEQALDQDQDRGNLQPTNFLLMVMELELPRTCHIELSTEPVGQALVRPPPGFARRCF
jgi:hypothetical protein